jgi:phage baseplate assembly protein V
VDHAAETCRVTSGDLKTNWIRWIALAAGTTRDWNPPTVGEQVLVLCPGGDPADAVVLRGLYSENAPAPSHSPDTHTRAYPDGAVIEYDHVRHALSCSFPQGATVVLSAPASVAIHTTVATIIADSVTLDTPSAIVTGNLRVDGGITAGQDITTQGDVKAGAISLKTHTHTEQGDGKKVSAPQ